MIPAVSFILDFAMRSFLRSPPITYRARIGNISASINALSYSKVIRHVAMLCALSIGVDVSITIYWFSDFFVSTIIGEIIVTTLKSVCSGQNVNLLF